MHRNRVKAAPLLIAPLLFSCAQSASTPQRAEPAPPRSPLLQAPSASPTASAAELEAGVVSSATPATSASPPPTQALYAPPYRFERALNVPVRWLFLGPSPYVAILSDNPWMYDGKAWRELPLPTKYRRAEEEREALGIYFGRDDKPRLMGARWSASASDPSSASRQVYLRFRAGAWQPDPKEIGRLGSGKPSGMYGILGTDDPEVVCKLGDACIIKRRSGWKTLPAGRELARTWLCSGIAFQLDSTGLSRLEDNGFARVAWDFDGKGKESGFWADSAQSYWVAVAEQEALYRFAQGKWTRFASPVKSPRALWGSSPNAVWVVGSDGAGHYDGTAWARVDGLSMPLEYVAGRSDTDVWVGGPQGVWRSMK